jgi:hypothetical protein
MSTSSEFSWVNAKISSIKNFKSYNTFYTSTFKFIDDIPKGFNLHSLDVKCTCISLYEDDFDLKIKRSRVKVKGQEIVRG